MSKVSIIISAGSRSAFLAKCIDSALGQTLSDVEVLVVDDGSSDAAPLVAKSFRSFSNLRYIRQQNLGDAAARNHGIEHSSGKYVCFLDSDDFYHREKIDIQAGILEESPDLDFVYCDIVRVDENDQETDESFSVGKLRQVLCGNIFSSLMIGGYFPLHTVMVKRSVLERFGPFDATLGGHADYELWLRLAAEGCKGFYLDRKLAFHRVSSDGMGKDGNHINETLGRALERITEAYPGAVAGALIHLQSHFEEQQGANAWLVGQVRNLEAKCNGSRYYFLGNCYRFLDHLQEARLIEGQPDQLATWNVEMNASWSRAIFLHPPAKLLFPFRDGGSGRLSFAIGMHPDTWHKTAPGGCAFMVTVDQRVSFQAVLDTADFMGDRKWHEYELDIPESANGIHIFEFETRCRADSNKNLWALWREPVFTSCGCDGIMG